MSITPINNNSVYNAYAQGAAAKNAEGESALIGSAAEKNENDGVTFEKSENDDVKASGYDKVKTNKLTKEQIDKLDTIREESLRNMVSQLLSQQANGITNKKQKNTLAQLQQTMSALDAEVNVSDIDNDPTFGIDAVATRIMDMAVALSGGDTSKIDTLREAVVKGFSEAGVELGTDLPDVCNKTYDEIMKRFDFWKENGSLENYAYNSTVDVNANAE